MPVWKLLLTASLTIVLSASTAVSACKIYKLTTAKKSMTVVASLISNRGPGTISVWPPGIPLAPHDLFMGNPNSRNKVVLLSGSSATFEACN